MGITNIPMLNADIVTGISLMLAVHRLRAYPFGFGTVLIAHITFNIPYVILSVMPKLKQTNRIHLRGSPGSGRIPAVTPFSRWFSRTSVARCPLRLSAGLHHVPG